MCTPRRSIRKAMLAATTRVLAAYSAQLLDCYGKSESLLEIVGNTQERIGWLRQAIEMSAAANSPDLQERIAALRR